MTKRKSSKRPADRVTHVSLHEAVKRDAFVMLTTSQCARWMGVETRYIIREINEGFLMANNVGHMGHRHDYRIYFGNFVAYLRARHWSKIPIDPMVLS